mgnify:CR=1 FL=1
MDRVHIRDFGQRPKNGSKNNDRRDGIDKHTDQKKAASDDQARTGRTNAVGRQKLYNCQWNFEIGQQPPERRRRAYTKQGHSGERCRVVEDRREVMKTNGSVKKPPQNKNVNQILWGK